MTLDVTPGSIVELLQRSSNNGSTSSVAATTQSTPAWLKLARSGNTYTASVSADGATWRTVGSTTVSLSSTVYVGLAVSSHDTTMRNIATFDNVSVGRAHVVLVGTQVTVTTGSGCSWTAVSNVPWITLSATAPRARRPSWRPWLPTPPRRRAPAR